MDDDESRLLTAKLQNNELLNTPNNAFAAPHIALHFLRSTIIPRDRDTRAITAALSKLVFYIYLLVLYSPQLDAPFPISPRWILLSRARVREPSPTDFEPVTSLQSRRI